MSEAAPIHGISLTLSLIRADGNVVTVVAPNPCLTLGSVTLELASELTGHLAAQAFAAATTAVPPGADGPVPDLTDACGEGAPPAIFGDADGSWQGPPEGASELYQKLSKRFLRQRYGDNGRPS